MDKELLAAIGALLDEKLEPIRQDITGLDQKVTGLQQGMTDVNQKVTGLQKQNDVIAKYVGETREDVGRLGEGQVKLSEGQFQLQSEVGELRRGQDRIEDRLDKVEAGVEVLGRMYRDHDTQIKDLQRKVASS